MPKRKKVRIKYPLKGDAHALSGTIYDAGNRCHTSAQTPLVELGGKEGQVLVGEFYLEGEEKNDEKPD